jgi:branched-chain amino acid transport system permease protein
MITLTYGFGAGLAALTGVFAAPIYQVNPLMGSNLIIVVFAVIVIGGLGSISGAILSGFALGVIEGITKIFYPEAANTVIFVIMVLVLLLRPAGIFGSLASVVTGHTINVSTQQSRHFTLARMLKIVLPAILLACIAPFYLYPVFLMKAFCFALLACAFNLLVGYAGLLSFGHAAFFGGSAYITAYSMQSLGLSPELGILAGVASATLMGLVFGWLSIRRQGIYFAMTTLALAQMVYFFALQAPFTGGEDGIQGVPRGRLFGLIDLGNTMTLYYVVLTICTAGFCIFYRTVHSPFGQILKAIRENEQRTVSLGFNVDRYKLLAFVLSAALAGLAGSTKLLVFQIATLTDVHWSMSGQVVLMTLLGGLGTITGPIVGAFLMVVMDNYLAAFGSWVTIIQGFIFVLCVLSFRRGIVGEAAAAFNALSGRARARMKSRRSAGDAKILRP